MTSRWTRSRSSITIITSSPADQPLSPISTHAIDHLVLAMATSPIIAMDADKLSYEIFSLLESKFLFGAGAGGGGCLSSGPCTPARPARPFHDGGGVDGRVRVLAIDGCGSGAGDALLAAAALARLEAGLRKRAGDPDARVADFFDVAAGAGAGGVLAAMLFMRGPDGRPTYTAEEALEFVAGSVGRDWAGGRRGGRWARLFRVGGGARKAFRRVFGDATLKDTVAPLLVPCYDLATAAPFMFSRADAVESDSFDFALPDVCAATCAAGSTAASVKSVDGRTSLAAASGGVAAMGNPAAAAITHVLHNKQEFPLATTVDDILLLSIGAATTSTPTTSGAAWNTPMPTTTRSPSPRELARVTAEGVADMVDESVAMAFDHTSGNYVRIQARKAANTAGEMLSQRSVESALFRGRRMSERTNGEKVDAVAAELVKEHERRRRSPLLPNVVIKQVATPRMSSATTASSGTARSASTLASPASYGSRQ